MKQNKEVAKQVLSLSAVVFLGVLAVGSANSDDTEDKSSVTTSAGNYGSNATAVTLGTDQAGTMTANGEDLFKIEIPSSATNTSVITIETKSEIDLQLTVLDENGVMISEDDDSGDDNNARLSIPVGDRDVMFVKVFPYSMSEVGSYTLAQTVSEPTALTFGESLNAQLTANANTQLYTLSVPASAAGSQLTIQTKSDLDTKIIVCDAQGDEVAEDDDTGEDENALVLINVTGAETYLVMVTPYDEDNFGAFELVNSLN